MLVLSRKPQGVIRVSDDIVVTVLAIEGKAVRIGIEAPIRNRVVRGELKRHALEAPHPISRDKSSSRVACDSRGLNAWETEGGAGINSDATALRQARAQANVEKGVTP